MYKKYDLECNKRARRKYNKKYYARTAHALNSYNRWTEEEISLILSHSMSDHELAELLGRSVRSIQVKRSNMFKVSYENK